MAQSEVTYSKIANAVSASFQKVVHNQKNHQV
jgi:hypothetical protein